MENNDRIGTIFGIGHVIISCLRLVAYMYNRQQKWLTEHKLPDLAVLRRVLRLGPGQIGDSSGVRTGMFTVSHDLK